MSTLASSPYVYERLENPWQQIRLLTVMPNRDRASMIETKLSVHPIPVTNASRLERLKTRRKLPWYFAVSYVWGQGSALEKTHEIMLDGHRFPVTANVHAALQENRSFASWPLRLWIDSICIDQGNLEEKDGQISLMREIYHLATLVVVSISPRFDEDLRLMRFISNLTQSRLTNKVVDLYMDSCAPADNLKIVGRNESRLEKARAKVLGKGYAGLMSGVMSVASPLFTAVDVSMNVSRDDQEFRQWPNLTPKFDFEGTVRNLQSWKPNDECLRAVANEDLGKMARLLERNLIVESQYFFRMWTLQEGVTGLVATVQHGGMQVQLEGVLQALHYLNANQKVHIFSQSVVETLTTLWVIKNAWQNGVRLTLRELLFHCRHRNCYDDKDVVFALLGLINGRTDRRLKPDKNKSVEEVYADVTQFIADSEHRLDIICCREWKEQPRDLPSWCPHFRQFGIFNERVPLIDASGRTTIFNASLKEPHSTSDILTMTMQTGRILKATGLYLGTVQRLSQNSESGESVSITERKWNTALTSSYQLQWEQLKMMSSLSELLCLYTELDIVVDAKSISANTDDNVKSLLATLVKPNTRDLLISYILTLVCGRTSPNTRCQGDEILSMLMGASVQDAAGKACLSLLCGALKDGVRGRRLAVLDEGTMGTVPVDAQAGDGIFVFIGCSVPVCLRRDVGADEWKLVGECYIHGYMDGEALRLRDEGKLSQRTILLV